MSGTHYYNVGDGKLYSTIQLAIDAIPGNLSGTGKHVVCVYPKAAGYTETLDIATGFSNGSVADHIEVQAMVPHGGMRDSGIIIDVSSAGVTRLINCGVNWTRFHGFCVTGTVSTGSWTSIITANNATTIIYDNILYGLINTSAPTFVAFNIEGANGGLDTVIYNNQLMDIITTPDAIYNIAAVYSVSNGSAGHPTTIANNSFLNNTSIYGMGIRPWGLDYIDIYNNYVGKMQSGLCYGGAFGAHVNFGYNISDDGTSDDFGGTGNLVNKAAVDQFKCVTPGSEDLRLKMTADCLRPGQDNSDLFDTDITGWTRRYWATGAFEPETESDCVFTTDYRNKILDCLFGGEEFPVPATLWLGLSATDPLPDGSGITEPTDVSYARQEAPNDTDFWAEAIDYIHWESNGALKTNAQNIFFPKATGTWLPIRYWFLADDEEAGNVVAYGCFTAPGKYFVSGDTPIISIGDLRMYLQNKENRPE